MDVETHNRTGISTHL